MEKLLLVALGGAVGAVARYGVGAPAARLFGPGQVWGTLAVNAVGGLLMGLLAGWSAARGADAERWRLLLGAGLLGGFTTFSAFSLETWGLLERGALGAAFAYAAGSVLLAVAALAVGVRIAQGAAA